MTPSPDLRATVITAPDSLGPVIRTMLHTIDRLDQEVPPRSGCLADDSPLREDDELARAYPLSDFTFGQLWRSSQLIDSWLLGAVASDDDGTPLVEDLASWAALLKDALELAATAYWVLSPIDGRTRVTRRLDLELHGLRDLRRAMRLADLPTTTADAKARGIARTARESGLKVRGRRPVRAVLDNAGCVSSAGADLVAVHALLSLAATGSRDALHSLGLIPILHPFATDEWEQLPTAMDGFTVAISACVTLLAAAYDRHAELRRASAPAQQTLRGVV